MARTTKAELERQRQERRDGALAALRLYAKKSKDKPADLEIIHERADYILLDVIQDTEISEAFHDIEKWYA